MKKQIVFAMFAILGVTNLAGCGSSSNNTTPPPPPPPPAAITVGGVVSDGAVEGGTLFVFNADTIGAALAALTDGGDRGAELTAAGPLTSLARIDTQGDAYTLEVPGSEAGRPVFLVFDNVGASDIQFTDTPPNLESVLMLGTAGSVQRLNVSLHSTMIAQQVRAQLDPDGDGTPVDDAAIGTLIQAARMNVLAAAGSDPLGNELFPNGEDPLTSDDADVIHHASGIVGMRVRTSAALTGLTLDEMVAALAADAGDGDIDGAIPAVLNPSAELIAAVEAAAATAAPDVDEFSEFAQGPCSTAAVTLRRACSFDVLDDTFEIRALCANSSADDERAECLAEGKIEVAEQAEECIDIFEARLEVCEALDDAAHEPQFGPDFAANFVDPREIGVSVDPNPYFPLINGYRWVYEGGDETIVVTVTDAIKLIDGVQCVTVNDIASEEGVVLEDTDDWFAQDLTGNVWYCGEISKNFELFDGDDPEEAELVDIDGSWKAGREGAEPGILFPAEGEAQIGDLIRQEVLFGEAEDYIEILSFTATESAPGGACAGNCLQTSDRTTIEPDADEHKFFAPGIGLIVELDPETGERLELTEFTTP